MCVHTDDVTKAGPGDPRGVQVEVSQAQSLRPAQEGRVIQICASRIDRHQGSQL